jgi:hypothetical protein
MLSDDPTGLEKAEAFSKRRTRDAEFLAERNFEDARAERDIAGRDSVDQMFDHAYRKISLIERVQFLFLPDRRVVVPD